MGAKKGKGAKTILIFVGSLQLLTYIKYNVIITSNFNLCSPTIWRVSNERVDLDDKPGCRPGSLSLTFLAPAVDVICNAPVRTNALSMSGECLFAERVLSFI